MPSEQFEYRYGGKRGRTHRIAMSEDIVVVRARGKSGRIRDANMSAGCRHIINGLQPALRFESSGVEVLRTHPATRETSRTQMLRSLSRDQGLRLAEPGLMDERSRQPVVPTENVFIKFVDELSLRRVDQLLRRYRLTRKRRAAYATNAWFVAPREGALKFGVFDTALELLEKHSEVELCHPELIRERERKVAFGPQWHLRETMVDGQLIDAHASVEEAWDLSEGEGTVIAVIDDGVDIDHEEFRARGGVVAPRDATERVDDPRPKFDFDMHGTACAGVACGSGAHGASGVAPAAAVMPIRLSSGLGSMNEADAFFWAADNGADVISCSWGPVDGQWWNPADPVHDQVVPLPDSTRLALEYATDSGRDGRGCVIAWAAGNGNESADNDGYASSDRVMAIAACNDRNTRSAYSDFGYAVWCAFPSSDPDSELTPGIWTTDRLAGLGYNPGDVELGDGVGNYTNSFGGTSSSCPGVAGIAALMLSVDPALHWDDCANMIAASCDRIDEVNAEYDADGHSFLYGYGRANARKALDLVLAEPD